MTDYSALITTFYTSFQRLDGVSMAQCYHPNAQFSDPVFPALTANEAGAMWQMLCAQAKNFKLSFNHITIADNTGSADWQAEYDFSKTGRHVVNKIHAKFHFAEGKIIKHQDDFNFWQWSKMALGPAGFILGWTPILQHKVQQQAAKNLRYFIQQHPT